ncbi:MAG: hypothetical protein ETSY1_11565 [Candidatus Entotheonella factor]|uniref:Uncharacterized protein n=1 Tax=Entotheonella factor TaxID=1429438 RepID=W4LQL3_ENTF1|nr:MAG: hypothetical protein ETSY1_11565 [Candidatus Entotheonella factor]
MTRILHGFARPVGKLAAPFRWLLPGLIMLALALGWQAQKADSQTGPVARFETGHGDLVVEYDAASNEWEFVVEVIDGTVDGVPGVEEEFESTDIRIVIPLTTREARPDNVPELLDFDPIGIEAGEDFWKLPQTETEASAEDAVFLGIAPEGVPTGVFQDDTVTWTLIGVQSPSGEGDFSLYQDAVPGPNFFMSSADPNASPGLPQPAGGHDHFNYAFTEPGEWTVEVMIDGTLLDGTPTSSIGQFLFEVVGPPPVRFQSGHGDLVVEYAAATNEWEFVVEVGGGTVDGVSGVEGEFEASDIQIVVPATAKEPRPENVPDQLDFSPIGVEAGVDYWKLPQTLAESEAEGTAFLGIAPEGVPAGVFQDDIVTWTLLSVQSPSGAGHFSLFQDAVPGPTFFMSSADASASPGLMQMVGGHGHFNYAFTEPGDWAVEIMVEATLLDGTVTSGTGQFQFHVEAQTPVVVQSGHGDLVVGYDPAEGAWEFVVEAEGVDPNGMPVEGEFDSETVYIAVPLTTQEARPENVPGTLDYDPIGIEAGATFWKLPQTETEAEAEGAMFLGIAPEEVPAGVFQNDMVTWTLTRIVPPLGAGDFSLYQDAVPGPTFFMSSADATANPGLDQSVGGHDHFNYGFTTPGLWQVEFKVDATLLDGTPSSATGRYIFQVQDTAPAQ